MNMNKTEKLLAARKRLKEFQQNKNASHENVPTTSKEHRRANHTEVPREKLETPSTTEMNFANSVEISVPKVTENLPEDSTHSESPKLTNVEDSPSTNYRLVEQETNERGVEISNEELSESERVPYSSANDPEIQDRAMDQQERYSLPPPASPSPPRFFNYQDENSEHTIDSPSSQQQQHLLQMAEEVADALMDNSTCTSTTHRDVDHEYRNQFLASCLQEQRQTVNELNVQVSHYSSRVAELEAIIATKDAEFETRLLREVNPLKEQLLVHAQTTGILVAEKAELTSAIEECRTIAQRKSQEVEELNSRLRMSQGRVAELEKELTQARKIVDDTRKMYQQLHQDYSELEKRHEIIRKSKDDDELEISELRQELSLRNAEITSLRSEIEEKNTLLSLNDLKIQQLSNTPQEMQALEGKQHALMIVEQQLSETRETMKMINREKDEAAKQYENYVRQLDARYESIVRELDETRKKLQATEQRENDCARRFADLEKDYENEKERAEKLLPLRAHEETIEHLTRSLDALNIEHSNLQTSLNERDTEIENLRRDLEILRETTDDNVEKSRLVSALESEQLGASRAVSQNQQLKAQMNEMHDAFVTLSNSKLDLTEQLQAERTIGKKLNAQLNKVERELDELREQLRLKEIAIDDMEREKLHTAQIADQMHHYQAQSNHARTLQEELQNSLGCMEILRRENQQLSMKLNELREEGMSDKILNGDATLGDDKSTDNTEDERKKLIYSSVRSDGKTMVPDPIKKLEIRFKETMERVAELTDEKQRLEHLVLQLQGETETIGEYITLYQKQRAILQRKSQEREETFRQLVEQRNHQQEQLHQLKVLVADLIKKQSSIAGTTSNDEQANEQQQQDAHVHEEKLSNTKDELTIDVKDRTTSKIIDLLTEIKDCQDTCIIEPNFHPCPWCSGKLITV